MPGSHDSIGELYGAARTLLHESIRQASASPEVAAKVTAQVDAFGAAANHAAHFGVLPLGFVLLCLHEQYRALSEGRAFRITYVLLRLVVVAGLLMEYDTVVRLITGLAGGGSWAGPEQIIQWVGGGADLTLDRYDGIGSLGSFFLWVLIFLVVVVCSLFALIVSMLLSISQGVLIAIALSLGKTCIAVSIVPGVGLAKSWARFLAMLAAWSTVANVIVALMQIQTATVLRAFIGGSLADALEMSARYVVMGAALGATPWITSALFNGVAAMAPGVAGPMAMAMRGGKAMLRGSGRLGKSALSRRPGASGGEAARMRPHKARAALAQSAPGRDGASANDGGAGGSGGDRGRGNRAEHRDGRARVGAKRSGARSATPAQRSNGLGRQRGAWRVDKRGVRQADIPRRRRDARRAGEASNSRTDSARRPEATRRDAGLDASGNRAQSASPRADARGADATRDLRRHADAARSRGSGAHANGGHGAASRDRAAASPAGRETQAATPRARKADGASSPEAARAQSDSAQRQSAGAQDNARAADTRKLQADRHSASPSAANADNNASRQSGRAGATSTGSPIQTTSSSESSSSRAVGGRTSSATPASSPSGGSRPTAGKSGKSGGSGNQAQIQVTKLDPNPPPRETASSAGAARSADKNRTMAARPAAHAKRANPSSDATAAPAPTPRPRSKS